MSLNRTLARGWLHLAPWMLPFADAGSAALPLPRLLRLALFQVSVGMATVLLTGTLNRVMILELNVPAWLVALMVALPIVFAPLRAFIGFRSDMHRSALGWRRVPYIWFGTLLQFGGFAIMPFALLVLSGDGEGPVWVGHLGAALAFLLVGAGLHTTQTSGLALATDLAPPDRRPRVVALLYVMLLAGMLTSALVFSQLLADYSPLRLIQVVQGAAVLTMALNLIALWKQEPRDPSRSARRGRRPPYGESWRAFLRGGHNRRFLVAVGLGSAGFSMQDLLLEPYGGEILHLSVADTTALTAFMACGSLIAFGFAANRLRRGTDPYRLAALGATLGLFAFAAVLFAAPLEAPLLFRAGTLLIGFGAGLFGVGTLIVAMDLRRDDQSGLALGAWGAAQATAAGLAIALGGALRDGIATLGRHDLLWPELASPATGYGAVYGVEILLLFATLIALGPLVAPRTGTTTGGASRFGLAQFPM